MSDVAHAFIESPQYRRGAMFIDYDEWGGFFDHVKPRFVPDDRRDLTNIDEDWGFTGFRIPGVAISPFTRGGGVSHMTVTHESILKLISYRFGLGHLNKRHRYASNIGRSFDFKTQGLRAAGAARPGRGSLRRRARSGAAASSGPQSRYRCGAKEHDLVRARDLRAARPARLRGQARDPRAALPQTRTASAGRPVRRGGERAVIAKRLGLGAHAGRGRGRRRARDRPRPRRSPTSTGGRSSSRSSSTASTATRSTPAERPFTSSLLAGQDASSSYFQESRAIMPTVTNANHMAMMSGAYAGNSGIPGNEFALYSPLENPDSCAATGPVNTRALPSVTSGESLTCPQAEMVFEAIHRQRNPDELVTAGIFGKPKLGRIFAGRNVDPDRRDVDHLWAPCTSEADDDDYCGDVETNPITGYAVDDAHRDERGRAGYARRRAGGR